MEPLRRAVADTAEFLRRNELPQILARIRERRVPVLVQFAIYGLCGGVATGVYLAVSLVLSQTISPAMDGMMVDGLPITDALRARNLLLNNSAGFLVSNVVAYALNVLFVFQTGRHRPVVEFLYFTGISAIAFVVGQFAGPWLVKSYGVSTLLAMGTNVVASMVLNFVLRKFVVFKG